MADEPQRFCLGIAYMPGKDDRIAKGQDGGRDFITEAELEKAAWSFLRGGPQVNAFHMAGTEGVATVVESSIHRGPDWDLGDGIVVTKGTWLVGAILEPRAWQMALDGRANGWSPEGIARRRKIQKEGAVAIAKSALPDGDGDDFTELLDCDFPKIGLVGKGANGIPRFLVMKNADGGATGLLDPEFVRGLIAKAEPAPEPPGDGQVTMTGSPAAIAAFIHKASVRAGGRSGTQDLADGLRSELAAVDAVMTAEAGRIVNAVKADMSGKSINDLPDSAFAYIESGGKKDGEGKTTPRSLRHFPIHDAAHVRNALSRAPQSPFGDKAMPKIRAAAKRFGVEVSKEAGVPDTVTKDMGPELDDGIDGMDPTVPLAAPEDDAPGDPTMPGSPAWEAIDAATACKWTSILARARAAVDMLAEREMLEAASADPDDMENAFDLQDACCAIDYVIGVLAPFAVAEQSAADCGADEMAMAMKSAAGPGALAAIRKVMGTAGIPDALGVIESIGVVVRKTGRVLSAVNEAHLREAHARLNTVLSSLPQAPTTDDGQPVAKEQETPVAVPMTVGGVVLDAAAHLPAADPVAKADADEQARNTGPVAGTGVPGMGAIPGRPQNETMDTPSGRRVLKAAVFDQRRTLLGLVDPAAIVQKADGDGEKKAMQAVFDQDGDLIGIVDPDAIQPVTGAGGNAAPDGSADGGEAMPAADPADMTPAPPAETGAPAGCVDDVAKAGELTPLASATNHLISPGELESIIAKAVAAVIGAQGPAQDIAKQADVAGLSEQVETLKARLAVVEEQPAAPKVFVNGQTPPAHQLRGQDQGAPPPVDIAKAAELKRTLYTGTAAEQQATFKTMEAAAVSQLAAMHAQRRQPA
jgi:hypothetical protein